MRRRMKLLTMALSSLLRSVPFATTSSDASGSRPATMGPWIQHQLVHSNLSLR